MKQLYALYLWGNEQLSGCIPAAWEAQLETGLSMNETVYDGTKITSFCST